MSEQAAAAANAIIRDPKLVKNRIFIGNLPPCTRPELESICHPYGNVLGSLVQKNFGFVQFESEEIANKVAAALTKSTFKGHIITVRNAGIKPVPVAGQKDKTPQVVPTVAPHSAMQPSYNDCEIVVVDRDNCKYAEYIEDRLKEKGLRVDVLFPNVEVPLAKVLANISSRGCLYAVLVTAQHVEHRSITVNILYGQQAEHRNMPLESAIQLISEDFMRKNGGMPIVAQPPVSTVQPIDTLTPAHPKSVQGLLALLVQNAPLTVLQYEHLIKYLKERAEQQRRIELGNDASVREQSPDPEIQMQKKLLNVLNKPSVADTQHVLLYNNLEDIKKDKRLMQMLEDPRIQRAMDNMMASPLVDKVIELMKFK